MLRHVDLSSSSDRKRGPASHFVLTIYRFRDRFAANAAATDFPE